jgi:superfamily I DNA/RNA helicase
MSKWVHGLNPEQAKAVLHNEGPLLILAGAGSGKTTVLVSRTGRLIEDGIVKPQNVLVMTFTNKAARELKHRVANKLGDQARNIWAGTFHSFGLQTLRKHHELVGLPKHFGVIDQSDSTAIVKELLKDVKVVGRDKYDVDELLNLINELRIQGRISTVIQNEYKEVAMILHPKFMKKMELLGVVDFEGLLQKPLELFKSHPKVLADLQNYFQYIMVDEFQDTNSVQMELVQSLFKSHRNIAVVGDDDQSIYGWRGAQVKNILQFPKTYAPCQVIRLERNYRSTPNILRIANEVIAKNKSRHGKTLVAHGHKAEGDLPEVFVCENEEDESEFVAREIQSFVANGRSPKDIAVLYRSNSQGGLIESVLRTMNIPYSVSGGTSFFDRKEVKDCLAYLRCGMTPNDVSLRRIINTPSRGIGDTTVERINALAVESKISFVKACYQSDHPQVQQLMQTLKGLPGEVMNPAETVSPGILFVHFMRRIGYREFLNTTTADPAVAEKKWLGVDILGRILDGFVKKTGVNEKTLRQFIDAMDLRDDQDEEQTKPEVSLMTLHAAKGLEFPVVMFVGVEEDLLPHRSLGSDVDEERRLFYVGVTRAKERLILSRCKSRKRHGVSKPVSPSRFLLEISKGHVRDYQAEYRPVSSEQRESLVSSFLSGLNTKLEQGK